ncbi:hypothetical protein B0H19DRAFT_1275872 [Mycena capillaripes]|nr:hypothetical protein B0H19DRAFT_1275872 [Mycena capillaripes]
MSGYSLPARGRCLHCPCQGSFFIVGDQDDRKPQAHTDNCVCDHSYTAHLLSSNPDPHDPNRTRVKGPNLAHNCGGFLAPRYQLWQPRTTCTACVTPWFHHADLDAQVANPLSFLHPNPSDLDAPVADPLTNTAFHPPSGSSRRPPLPPPSSFYRTARPLAVEHYNPSPIPLSFETPQPDRGTILEMRDHSRLENLPQHNSRRPGPPPTAGTSRRGPSTGSASSSANPFTSTATTVRSTSSSSTSKKKSKTKSQGEHQYLVCILPFCHGDYEDPGEPSPKYAFVHDEVKPLLQVLTQNDLTFEVTLLAGLQEGVWRILDQALHSHAEKYHIVIPPSPEARRAPPSTLTAPYNPDFDYTTWGIVQTRSNKKEQRRKLKLLQWYEYSYKEPELHAISNSIKHPRREELCLLFIEPLFGNIRAPLGAIHTNRFSLEQGPPHRCLPFRVWALLSFQNDIERHECFSPLHTCVTFSSQAAPIPDTFHQITSSSIPSQQTQRLGSTSRPPGTRSREKASIHLSLAQWSPFLIFLSQSPAEEEPPTSRRRLHGPSEEIPEDLLDWDIEFPTSLFGALTHQPAQDWSVLLPAAPSPEIPIPSMKSWERATGVELLTWISNIVSAVHLREIQPLDIRGPNPTALALTLCSLIQYNDTPGLDFAPEEGVMCQAVPDLGLLTCFSSFHNDPAEDPGALYTGAQGEGPERTVHAMALKIRTSDDTRWQESFGGQFRRPILSANTHDPMPFYIDGRYAAIHILRLETGPMPISPFFIFAATQPSRMAMAELTLPFFNTLDQQSAMLLRQWFEFDAQEVLPRDDDHPIIALVSHYLPDILTDWFMTPRTFDAHRDVHCRLLERIFLGQPDVWDHSYFAAFRRGFCLPLAEPRDDFAPPTTMGDHWASALTVMRYLTVLYDRQVKDPEEVISRLCLKLVVSTDLYDAYTPESKLYAQLFTWRLWRWLKGVGYPAELRGTYVTEEEYQRHRASHTLRAARLLYCMTESWTLPAAPTVQLGLDLRVDNVPADIGGLFVFWHSCTRVAEVYFHPWLKNVLLEPGDLEEIDTVYRFDIWMSKITCLKGGDYNRL